MDFRLRQEHVCPLPGAGQNGPLPLLLRHHNGIEDTLINGGPYPHGQVAKALPVVRFATHTLHVSVDYVVGLKLPAATLADKQMASAAKVCAGQALAKN